MISFTLSGNRIVVNKLLTRAGLLLIAVILSAGPTISCNGNDPDTVDVHATPADVMAELPIYPDATLITSRETGFEPFSVPQTPELNGSPPYIKYETVSSQYAAQSQTKEILDWYSDKLKQKGYEIYSDTTYSHPLETDVIGIGYHKKAQPLISVEVHAYDSNGKAIFAIIVSKDITTNLNTEHPLPGGKLIKATKKIMVGKE